MPKVRATFEPDKVLDVTDREAYDLRQQGLLVAEDEDKAPAQSPGTEPTTKDEDDKAKGGPRSKAKDEGS